MDTPQPTGSSAANATSAAHAKLAQSLAEQAASLLQNTGSLLPLSASASVAVIGAAADCNASLPTSNPSWWCNTFCGCLSGGGGSGAVAPSWVTPILAAVRARSSSSNITYSDGRNVQAAVGAAAAADVTLVIVVAGSGVDRNGAALPADQLVYLKAVATAGTKTAVLVMAPGAVLIDWVPQVDAILSMWMPGQGQGTAAARFLFGDVSPSGTVPDW